MIWVALLFVVVVAVLGLRFVRTIEALVEHVKRQGTIQPAYRPSQPSQSSQPAGEDQPSAGTKKTTTVGQLSPELIAPGLRKPPKSRGGVGSRVRKNDDIQVQSGDRSQEGSEGGDPEASQPTGDSPQGYK